MNFDNTLLAYVSSMTKIVELKVCSYMYIYIHCHLNEIFTISCHFCFRTTNFKTNQTGGFQNKRRTQIPFQTNKVSDVSITVPAVKKTFTNVNRTNQLRDAREKLTVQAQPSDARERLNKKAQGTDARQKLLNIRAQREPVDARAKLVAKKQHAAGPQTQASNFTVTRTVRKLF